MAQEFSESESLDARINDANEQASELSEDTEEQDREDLQEFREKTEMLYWKKGQTAKSFREAADKLDQVFRDCKGAHAFGTAGAVLSGLITIGTLVTTWGAASPLLLATGMGLGLGGAAINLGTNDIETAANSVAVKRAQRCLNETSDCVDEVNALIKHWLNTKERARLVYICSLAAEQKFGPFFMKFLGEVQSFCSKTISTLKVKTPGMVVRRAFSLGKTKDTVKSVERAAGQAGGKVGENVAREALIVINVAFLMFDAVDLHYTIRDILENKGSEAAKRLREQADILEGL